MALLVLSGACVSRMGDFLGDVWGDFRGRGKCKRFELRVGLESNRGCCEEIPFRFVLFSRDSPADVLDIPRLSFWRSSGLLVGKVTEMDGTVFGSSTEVSPSDIHSDEGNSSPAAWDLGERRGLCGATTHDSTDAPT